jgi:hypothetical protein
MRNWLSKIEILPLILVIFFIVFSWIAFPVNFYANVDEHNYLNNSSLILTAGSPERAGGENALGGFINNHGLYVSKYNLGASVLFLPFSAFHDLKVQLAANLVLFILIIILSYQLGKRLKLNPYLYLLVGLSPALFYFSRTAFSEMSSALLILASFILLIDFEKVVQVKQASKKLIIITSLLAASLGLLVFTRYTLAIWPALVSAWLMWKLWKSELTNKSKLSVLAVYAFVAGIFICAIGLVNYQLYGHVLSSGYSLSGEESLMIREFLPRIAIYLVLLNIMFPGQLLLSLIQKYPLQNIVKPAIIMLVVISSLGGGFLVQYQFTDPITAVRFLIPFYPLMLIAYAQVMSWVCLKLPKFKNLLIIAISLALLVTNGTLAYMHSQFLNQRADAYYALEKNLTADSLTFGAPDDFIFFGSHLRTPDQFMAIDSLLNADNNQLQLWRQKYPHLYLISTKFDSKGAWSVDIETITAKMNYNVEPISTESHVKIYELK